LPNVVPYRRLKDLSIVIPSRRHGLRRILDATAAEVDFALKPRLEIDTLSAICEIIATTDLITVLPGIALYPNLTMGKVDAYRLCKPGIVRTIAWVTHPRRVVSAAMTAVMEVIAEDLQTAATSASRLVNR
jgi:DNA-binding transcriptional LysR family regulator